MEEKDLDLLDKLDDELRSEEQSRSKAIEQLSEPSDIRHGTDLSPELCIKNALLIKIGDGLDELGGAILKDLVNEFEHRLISKNRGGRTETVDVIRASREFEMQGIRQKMGMMLGGFNQ